MYICLCNAIKERDIRKVLEHDHDGKATVSGVYHACSDGEKPQCCSCLQTIKDIVGDHKGQCMSKQTASEAV